MAWSAATRFQAWLRATRSRSRSPQRERPTSYRRAVDLFALLQRFCDLLFVGHLSQLMHVDVADYPRRVDDDDRALRSSDVGVEDAVGLRHLPVRPEVAAQRILRASEGLRPCL